MNELLDEGKYSTSLFNFFLSFFFLLIRTATYKYLHTSVKFQIFETENEIENFEHFIKILINTATSRNKYQSYD